MPTLFSLSFNPGSSSSQTQAAPPFFIDISSPLSEWTLEPHRLSRDEKVCNISQYSKEFFCFAFGMPTFFFNCIPRFRRAFNASIALLDVASMPYSASPVPFQLRLLHPFITPHDDTALMYVRSAAF
jgi:hypothetical protein